MKELSLETYSVVELDSKTSEETEGGTPHRYALIWLENQMAGFWDSFVSGHNEVMKECKC